MVLTDNEVELVFGKVLLIGDGSLPCDPHAFIYGVFTAIGSEGALNGVVVHFTDPV